MSESLRLPELDEEAPLPVSDYRSLKDGDLVNPISLGEFLGGVGGLMRLPPKELEKLAPTRVRRATRILFPAAAVVLTVLLAAIKPGAFSRGSTEMPAGLNGQWMTIATNYSDRVLEFLPGRVVFRSSGTSDSTEHRISRVVSEQIGDTTLVTLSYLESGGSYELALKYTTVPEPGIRFTNQDYLVWRPVGTPSR